jgi:hypothetical protein
MKSIVAVMVAVGFAGASSFAAEQTWTGKISDSMCGATYKKTAEHGTAQISDRDCTLACVKNGGKYVFVHNGKVYNSENQDYEGVQQHAGESVRLTGEMSGNSVKVSNIESSGRKS